MSEYRTASIDGCHLTAAQLSELAHAKITDAQAGDLAALKLRSVRGLPDFQVVAIAVQEVLALGGTVGIDVFTTNEGRRHIIKSAIARPRIVKAAELKALAASSTAGFADALSEHLQGLAPDADVTLETELYDTLAVTAQKRARREREKKPA